MLQYSQLPAVKFETVLSDTLSTWKRLYCNTGSLDVEEVMRAMGLGESAFRRVILISGATAGAMLVLMFAKPLYYAATVPNAASSADVPRRVPEVETVSFVASPTVDTNPQFFFGSGDGSNGYYAERSEPGR
jgi:hypothetical protein